MAALLEESAVFKNQYPVRHPHRGAVGKDNRDLALGQFGEALENLVLRTCIQRRRRVIQNQQPGIAAFAQTLAEAGKSARPPSYGRTKLPVTGAGLDLQSMRQTGGGFRGDFKRSRQPFMKSFGAR